MTLRQLASEITKREGGKSSVAIGDVREVLRLLCQIEAEFRLEVDEGVGGTSPLSALENRARVLYLWRKRAGK